MIKISELQKVYRTEEVETIALNRLTFDVKEGEFVAVMGPSGCGKSTLLNILGLLDDPDGGSFLFNGNEVMQLLTDLNEQGTTIIMVTHSEHDSRYSHRIIRMLDGQTVTENILV